MQSQLIFQNLKRFCKVIQMFIDWERITFKLKLYHMGIIYFHQLEKWTDLVKKKYKKALIYKTMLKEFLKLNNLLERVEAFSFLVLIINLLSKQLDKVRM